MKFFPVLEEIQVTTAGLEEPKVRSFQLVLDPYQDFFKDCYNSLQLIYDRTVKLKLDKDLSFELKGEQIGYCDRPSAFSIKYSGEGQSDYRFIADKFDADQLVFTVQKNEYGGGPKPPLYKPVGNKGPSGDTQNAMSRRLILNIKDKAINHAFFYSIFSTSN